MEEHVGKGYPYPEEVLLIKGETEKKEKEIQVFTILARKQNQPLTEDDFQKLLRICYGSDFETVWRIVYGVSAYDFEAAEKWLEFVIKPFGFTYEEQKEAETKIFPQFSRSWDASLRFACGVVAGMLKTNDKVNILHALATIIANNNDLMDNADWYFTSYRCEKAVKELKGTLTNIIHEQIKTKHYENPDDKDYCTGNNTLLFYESLSSRVKGLMSQDKQISKLGKFILNQICQAVFSIQSTNDKMKALELLRASKK